MTDRARAGQPLHRHLGRRPRRRRHRRLPALPRLGVARRIRRLGGHLREPLRRPAGPDRLPELGLGPAPGRERGRRHRRRGALPEHRARRSSRRAACVALPPTAADYERRWAGIQAHNRWLADFCARAPGRRAGVAQIFANRHRRRPGRGPVGGRHLPPFGGILLPSLPARVASCRGLWEPDYEPLWELCEELGVVVNIHGGRRHPRLRRRRGGPGHHAGRAAVVLPPVHVAPHLRRRAGAAPDPQGRAHRAGTGLAARGASRPSTGSTGA